MTTNTRTTTKAAAADRAGARAPKVSAVTVAALVRTYHAAPLDLADFFELANRTGDESDPSADAWFETLVEQELTATSARPRMTTDAYLEACDQIRAQQPTALRALAMKVSDHEGDDHAARADVAFRLGIELGRVLAGGAR